MDYRFKMLYVFGIIFVVAGHTGNGFFNILGLFQYDSFHMALFAFAAGYFYDDNVTQDTNRLYCYIVKKCKKFLIPYFVWNAVYGFITVLLNTYFGCNYGREITIYNFFVQPFILGDQFSINVASWFILTLFLVEIVNVLIRTLTNRIHWEKERSSQLLFLLIGISGILLAQSNYQFTSKICITRVMVLVFVYNIGYLYKIGLEQYDTATTNWYLFRCIIVQMFLFLLAKTTNNVSIVYNSTYNFNFFIVFAFMFNGIMFWLRISKELVYIIEKSNFLKYMANHTFDIMMHHCFVLKVFIVSVYALSKHILKMEIQFDMDKFKRVAWYFPDFGNNPVMRNLYLIVGIVGALGIGYLIEIVKKKICTLINEQWFCLRRKNLNGKI